MKHMRHKLLLLSLFFLFVVVMPSYAATPIPAIPIPANSIPILGVTCGDAKSLTINKCCQTPIYTPQLIDLGAPLDTASKLVSDMLKNKLGPIIESQKQISINPCMNGSPSTPGDTNNSSCICIIGPTKAPLGSLLPVCNRIGTAGEQSACTACSKGGGLWTSLGCFSGNISEFISQKILGTGIGLAGGISLLCIMFAAFQMQTSGGNAEKVKKAQELLTNCITGLMVIIFSTLLLKIIGVDILKIPGLQ